MKNKILSLFLCFLFVFNLFVFSVSAGTEWHKETFGGSVTVTVNWCDINVQPRVISENLTIANWSTNVKIDVGYWNMSMVDDDGNMTDGTIEIKPSVGFPGGGVWNGQVNVTEGLEFHENLAYSTNYTVYVNMSDECSNVYLTFWFVTEENPVSGGTVSWVSTTFGGSVTVEPPPPPPETVWVSRNFGAEVVVEGYQAGDWSDWWVMYYYGSAPSYTNITPANNSIVQRNDAVVNLSADFIDLNGDSMNISWYYSDNNTLIGSNNSVGNGTYMQSINVVYQQVLNWSINATDGTNWRNTSYTFTVEDLNPVVSLAAVNYNSSAINLSWSKNSNVTTSYIRYKKDSAPTTRTEGTLLTNTTNTSYNHTGLNPGSHYYYSIWSYNSTDNVFSNSYTTNDTYTNPGRPSDFQVTSVLMNVIDFSFSKGVNATHTVLFMNASGVSQYPNVSNGVEMDNTTGLSVVVDGLISNTTYFFSLYSYNNDSGLYSLLNRTVSETTLELSSAPTGSVATTLDESRIRLTWVKGSEYSVVVRKKDSYPSSVSDGTEVYNGTGVVFTDTGLLAASKYYYRFYGWNGEQISVGFSSAMNITLPAPPINLVGEVSGDNLIITWEKGAGAIRTVIRNSSISQPVDVTDGDLVYNGTGVTYTHVGVSSINYYSGWSYVLIDDRHLYSTPVYMIWGGIEINAYDEYTLAAITDYTVFITNKNGTETYVDSSGNNPFRIAVEDVPNGEDSIIQVSKTGYRTRTQTLDLYPNIFYDLSFYLPPLSIPDDGGMQPGENYTYLYQFNVIDALSSPVSNVFVEVKKYINTTDSYATVWSDYTDANGRCTPYLVSFESYKVFLSKTGYEDSINDIIADPNNREFTFLLLAVEEPSTPALYPHEYVFFCNRSNRLDTIVYLDFLNTYGQVFVVTVRLMEINISTGNETVFYTTSFLMQNSFNRSVSGLNSNNSYVAYVTYVHSVFGMQSITCMFSRVVDTYISPDSVNVILTSVFGLHPLVWSHFLMLLLAVALFFYTDEEHMGVMLIVMGVLFLFINIYLGFDNALTVAAGGLIPGLCIIVGVLLEWIKHNRRSGG